MGEGYAPAAASVYPVEDLVGIDLAGLDVGDRGFGPSDRDAGAGPPGFDGEIAQFGRRGGEDHLVEVAPARIAARERACLLQ